ncbi:hypothetical protein QQ045_032159 [Rhodiola kirilowii]
MPPPSSRILVSCRSLNRQTSIRRSWYHLRTTVFTSGSSWSPAQLHAGSIEHMAMFPVDTVKTQMQALGSCPTKSASVR